MSATIGSSCSEITSMTRLLISVRSAAEAKLVCDLGVHLLDVKEPQLGSLGQASIDVVQEVRSIAPSSIPMSIALGELVDWRTPKAWPEGIHYAKLGLAGAKRLENWQRGWGDAVASFPRDIRPVAVAYADWQEVDAPSIEEVIQQAARHNCPVVLIDTCQKDGRTLLDYCSQTQLSEYSQQLRSHDLQLVLAGSLQLKHLKELLPLRPAYFGVRGAVCSNDRTGELDPNQVQRWLEYIQENQ